MNLYKLNKHVAIAQIKKLNIASTSRDQPLPGLGPLSSVEQPSRITVSRCLLSSEVIC